VEQISITQPTFPTFLPESAGLQSAVELEWGGQRVWKGKGTRPRPKGIIYTCCLTASELLSSRHMI